MNGFKMICSAIGRLIRIEADPPEQEPAANQARTEEGTHPGLTDQQLVVLLTAAASEVIGQPVRVGTYRPLTSKELNWAAQGRSELHSHRLK